MRIVDTVDTTCEHNLYVLASKIFHIDDLATEPLQSNHQQPHCAQYRGLQIVGIQGVLTGLTFLFLHSLHNSGSKNHH